MCAELQEWLIDKKEEHGQPIIASNSWGAYACEPPASCEHPVVRIIQEAVKAGIIVVFAAGNNHELCEGKSDECVPNTIWMQNSLDEVLSLGTVDEHNNLRKYSSRGPGQCAQKYSKPDCVAPTYGVVMRTSLLRKPVGRYLQEFSRRLGYQRRMSHTYQLKSEMPL